MKPVALIVDPDGDPSTTARPSSPPVTARGKLLPTLPPDAPLMTRNEVAALLRTTPRQISNMMARGQIPAPVRVAGLGARWRRSEIDAWIDAQ